MGVGIKTDKIPQKSLSRLYSIQVVESGLHCHEWERNCHEPFIPEVIRLKANLSQLKNEKTGSVNGIFSSMLFLFLV